MADFTKSEAEVAHIIAKWGRFLEYQWQEMVEQGLSSYVRPTKHNGFEYECTTAGYTSSVQPVWPLTIGDTVADGSVVWTCRAYDVNATDKLSSVAWTVPAGLTAGTVVTDLLNSNQPVSGGGAVSGVVHSLVCKAVTTDGRTEEQIITVEME